MALFLMVLVTVSFVVAIGLYDHRKKVEKNEATRSRV